MSEIDAIRQKIPQARRISNSLVVHGDSFEILDKLDECSIHGVVSDPPYGVREFSEVHVKALESGSSDDIWQTFRYADGANRVVQPCFSTLTAKERAEIRDFFALLGKKLSRILLPGGHAIIAGHVSLAPSVFGAIADGGLEYRGSIIRMVCTLRGGDRPPGAQAEFPDVCTLPRSMHEPWGLFRKPMPKGMTIPDCLRKYGTGALRRQPKSERQPDGAPVFDVIDNTGRPTRAEREIAPHPNLKPQRLMRALVHSVLPMRTGVVIDPFMGSGSTVAAGIAVGVSCVGIEKSAEFYKMAQDCIPKLSRAVPEADKAEKEPPAAFLID